MAQTITATDVELQKPVNVVFQQTFLRRAQQNCPYFAGTQPGTINRQQGTSTIKWRRIEQLAPSTTALTELTTTASYMQGRDSVTPSFTDVTATVSKYGQFYIVSEEVDIYNPNGTTDEMVGTLGESAGRGLNMLQRNIAEDDTTQRYAGNVASIGLVDSIITAGVLDRVLNELSRNSARTFTPMTTGSQNIGTAPILRAYWAVCHPDVAHDVKGISGFSSVEKYAGQVAIAQDEFGYYAGSGRGIRFLMSEDASIDENTGDSLSGADLRATSGLADIYTISVWGQDALGSVGLGMRHTDGVYRAGENQGGFELIFKDRKSGGTSDPLEEISTLGYKFFYSGAVLNANWARAIRVAATNLSN